MKKKKKNYLQSIYIIFYNYFIITEEIILEFITIYWLIGHEDLKKKKKNITSFVVHEKKI